MRALLLALLLAGCYADPTGPTSAPNLLAPPPAASTAPAILFTNGCGFAAVFDLYTDGIARGMYILTPDQVVSKAVTAGPHLVAYMAVSMNGRPLNWTIPGETVTVTGPTPYVMTC